MYFGVIDHYNDDSYNLINIEQNIEECFICFEIKCPHGNYPIKLNSKLYYYKKCLCDGFIHKFCLDIWYNNTSRCPICRKGIEKRTKIITLLHEGTNILFIYLTIKNNMTILIKYFCIIFFIYETFNFYFIIYKKNFFLYDDDFEYNNYYTNYYLNNSCI